MARVDAIVRPWASHKDLSAVVEKAREALATHPQFKAERAGRRPNRTPGPDGWPGDEARLVDLDVFLIHVAGE